MNIHSQFKNNVRNAILQGRDNYGGSDAAYAKSIGINSSVYSRLKNGEIDRIVSDAEWIRLGRELQVNPRENTWKTARTEVYSQIEDNIKFCQRHSKGMILIDICGIGKTYSSQRVTKSLRNAFYFDCSQGKTRQSFIRGLAKTVGIDHAGRYVDVKANLKYYLNVLENPIITLDDAGYLDYPAFLEVHELWNGTENNCGWYMIGDDSLQSKVTKGINSKKIGYAAVFSRFSEEFIHLVPYGHEDRQLYLKQLIGDVASVNIAELNKVPKIITKCIKENKTLRNVDTIIRNMNDEQIIKPKESLCKEV